VTITYTWQVPQSGGAKGDPSTIVSLTLFEGTQGQSPWGYLTSNHPGQDLNYPFIAYVANSHLYLASSGELPAFTFEIAAQNIFGAGFSDCNPRDNLQTIFTDPRWGLGWNSSLLDLAGTWANFSAYCLANGIFLSTTMDSQEQASAVLQRYLQITNSEAVWSGNILKLIPYGDTTLVGNGVTFSPNTTPIYDLGDDDFIADAGNDPVTIEIPTVTDAYNDVKVEYVERSNAYNPEIVEAKDDASIYQFGVRPMDTITLHDIKTQRVAALVADQILRNSVYKRKKYNFKTRSRYALLEPMDMVTLTDSNLGLSKTPVRLLSIEEDDKRQLKMVAEEFPWGTATPTLYPKQLSAGFQPNSAADPGPVNPPIIFEANNRVTGQIGYQLWFGVSGLLTGLWGGCRVYLSENGTDYKQILDINGNDKIHGAARMGVTTATFASGSDPDTTHTCSIDLGESAGQLTSGASGDADALQTLCLVDSELIAFSTATLVAGNQYNLTTYIRRGLLNSTIASHSSGAPFLRIDEGVFKWAFDASMIGKTLHFKFTSFNVAQNMEQSLSDATDYTITIAGSSLGLLSPAHSSYRPLTNPLTGHDAGASATINIASFTMRIAGVDIAEGSGSITGLSYNTLYYLYFDDPGFVGGAVTYVATTTKETAIAVAGRFFVGSIQTPQSGALDTVGNGDGGTGAQSGLMTVFSFALGSGSYAPAQQGNALITNPGNCCDGDRTNYADMAMSGNGQANTMALFLVQPPGMVQRFQSLTLKVRRSIPTNSLTAGKYTLSYQFTSGTPTVIETAAAGATLTDAIVSVSLPPTTPLASLIVSAQVTAQGSGTGGSIASASRITPVSGSYYVQGFGWVYYSYESEAQFVTSSPHGLSNGNVVNITGVSPTTFNASGASVTVINTTTFKISQVGSVGETGTGGSFTTGSQAASGSFELKFNEAWVEGVA
jgi:hypothetical protein